MAKRPAKKSASRRTGKQARSGTSTEKAAAGSKAKKQAGRKAASRTASRTASKGPGRARRSASQERLEHLQQLIELMVDKGVVEVELEEAGGRWRVRRTDPHAVTYAAPAAMPMPGAVAPPVASGSAPAPAAFSAPEPAASEEPAGEVYPSPMLGTFYRAASPDAEPFVKEGDRVGPDTTVCIIEAMKVMNEIKAEREFEIVEVLVKNGDPVEYGQPLFLIR